jgi:hypothetical protein
VLGLLAAYFPRPGTAGWPAAWQRYVKAFHLDGATESAELADFRRTVVKSVLRADRYFSARLTVGAEAHRGKDRTQAVLGKDLVMFHSVYRILRVCGPPGSGTVIILYGSGSFLNKQKSKENLDFYYFVIFF